MAGPGKKTPNWLWIVVLAVLAVLLIAWALDPSGDADESLDEAVSLPQDGYVVQPTPAAPEGVELPTAVPTVGDPAISPTPIPATPQAPATQTPMPGQPMPGQ